MSEFGIPAESDMFWDEGVLRSSTTAREYGGISRGSLMVLSRAIEPAAIEKITPEQKFGVDMPSAKPEWEDEVLRPSPLMRRLGYTAHPDACTHFRKRLMLRSTQWTCADCGVSL